MPAASASRSSCSRLPHAAEHDRVRAEPGVQRAIQLAARYDVHARRRAPAAGAAPRVGVGLHAVVQAMRHRRKHTIEHIVLLANGARAVHVRGGADRVCDRLERHAFTHELTTRRASESGRGQYAFAHSASVVEGSPHLRQCVTGSAERNSSLGKHANGRLRLLLDLALALLAAAPSGVHERAVAFHHLAEARRR